MRLQTIERNTKETRIKISLELDGKGKYDIKTPIGFFNHMLESFARHGGYDLSIEAKGDIETGGHHLVEDTGIALGQLVKALLCDGKGINRYGFFALPMDEVLVTSAIDISGRGGFYLEGYNPNGNISNFDLDLTPEFFNAFAKNAEITLHIDIIHTGNKHHVVEAMFKSTALALKTALNLSGDYILSTKGIIFND